MTASVSSIPNNTIVSKPISFTDFEPTYIMILTLSFITLLILAIILVQVSYPKFWNGMINTPLFKKR